MTDDNAIGIMIKTKFVSLFPMSEMIDEWAAREVNEAERVWLSMWIAAHEQGNNDQ